MIRPLLAQRSELAEEFKEKQQTKETMEMAIALSPIHIYDELTGPATASKLAKVFLYSCLCSQTFAQVALADGMPVGVIMGKNLNKHKCPFKYRVKQITSILSLLLSGEGRQVIKMFGCISGIDKKLLKDSGKNYQGEITFFAVDSEFRGRGVGKVLFQNIKTYMKHRCV